jgi:hypothetical protein
MRRGAALAVAALALAAGVAGCGLGAGGDTGVVSLIVTRDFGAAQLPGSPKTVDAPGSETAMRALQRSFSVRTRYGGGFVESIDGEAGGTQGGRPVDWFYYVNGVEAPRGAASTGLHRGDVVWWDRHDWGTAQRIPAVVGAFPEPFLHGSGGTRFPVRVECAAAASAACQTVQQKLGDAGVIAGEAAFGSRGGEDLLRVVVGLWPAIDSDFATRLLKVGPGVSGVFARPSPDGTTIAVLDPRGRTVRTLGPGTGLIAATITQDQPPVWIVTGTDPAGLALAARSLTSDVLRDRFAVALRGGRTIALPQVSP